MTRSIDTIKPGRICYTPKRKEEILEVVKLEEYADLPPSQIVQRSIQCVRKVSLREINVMSPIPSGLNWKQALPVDSIH